MRRGLATYGLSDRKRRAKRFNKRIELFASHLNGAALAVSALGVFRFVLDLTPSAPPLSPLVIVGLVALSVTLHVLAQIVYFALKAED